MDESTIDSGRVAWAKSRRPIRDVADGALRLRSTEHLMIELDIPPAGSSSHFPCQTEVLPVQRLRPS